MVTSRKAYNIIAVVPAAGSGKRFHSKTKKTFQRLGKEPLIICALKKLEAIDEIREIIPVFKKKDMEYAQEMFKKYHFRKIKKIASGGKERQHSVYNGLKLVADQQSLVLIHDGVRPLIEKTIIKKLIQKISDSLRKRERCDGIILGVPVKDTIKEVQFPRGRDDETVFVKKTLERNFLWAVQTPQIFLYSSIMNAYVRAMDDKFYATDDSALVERYGGIIKVIRGSYSNIKITTPEDITVAEALQEKK
jgi:2-C-methyl-D-erythritol 4-phosphate cytidylyltransferase